MGGFTFAAPILLAGLAALPLLWLIIRRSPPPANLVALPTLKLLSTEDIPPPQAARAPIWLLLFRLAALALLVLGLAGPRIVPEGVATHPAQFTILIDNGVMSAARWDEMRAAARDRIDALADGGTRFRIAPTAEEATPSGPLPFVDAETARAQLSALPLRPWLLDREAAARRIDDASSALWVSDGMESDGANALREALGSAEVASFPSPVPVILGAGPTHEGVAVRLSRALGQEGEARVRVKAANGREIASARAPFDNRVTAVRIPVAGPDAADAHRVTAGPGAAATQVLSGGLDRARAAIFDNGGDTPPLQRGSFYIRRAVEPFADVVETTLAGGPDSDANLFLFDDVPLTEAAAEPYLARIRDGAVAISFAGPRTAENGTALSPVPLRVGARAFGGSLSWDEPQHFAAFDPKGPLAGLTAAKDDHEIRRQLLARDMPANTMTWARLGDGTPAVTARREGRGLLVMLHTSAAPDWSDLPLSGLFARLLERLVPLARSPQALDISGEGEWILDRELNADGTLGPPERAARVGAEDWPRVQPAPETPPGLYRSGDAVRALNLSDWFSRHPDIRPLETGSLRRAETLAAPREFGPILLALAAIMLAVDLFVALFLRGAILPRTGSARRAAAPTLAVLAALLFAGPLLAQQSAPPPGDSGFSLAYVGGTADDAVLAEGLANLSEMLRRRTAVSPGPPRAVRPDAPDLGRYPLLYWPAAARGAMTAPEAQNLRAYLARGGMVIFDFGRPFDGTTDARTLLSPLGLPTLDEVGPAHVLMKSYYLLGNPGGGALWVEAGTEGESGQVSSVLIGGGDWARIWAGAKTVPPSVRENAFRFGINAVFYALTGTYKADQVHTRTLLDRIGRERAE